MLKVLMIMTLLLGACSSYRPKVVDNKKTIKRDYDVTNASSRYRPTWIEDAQYWAKKSKEDVKNWNFFSYETTPRADRELACDIAKASVNADIASTIKNSIEKSLNSYREDGQTALSEGGFVRSYIDRTLKSKISGNLVGVVIGKTYWEQRKFSVEKGASSNSVGYTCAILAKIQKKNLELAIDKAFNDLYKSKEGAASKEQITKAIQTAVN